MVKISIREQLAAAFLLTSLLSLMVLALSTWFQNKNFITGIRLSGLSLAASLKAAQVSSTLLLYEAQIRSVSTRILIQSALLRYNNGNNTNENWSRSQTDLESALSIGNLLVQATIFPNRYVSNITELNGLINVTTPSIIGTIPLPYTNPDGSQVYLGDSGLGYPPALYPDLVYGSAPTNSAAPVSFDGQTLDPHGALFLGPLIVNQTFSLISATIAVINNTSMQDVLGWMTIVIESTMIYDIVTSLEGLGYSGEVLLVGPSSRNNHFEIDLSNSRSDEAFKKQDLRFVLPPLANASVASRHSDRIYPRNISTPFPMTSYPAAQDAWTANNNNINNAGALISTNNEQNYRVSVGYARVATPVVDWALLIEQSFDEVVAPINHLRDVVLICVFSVMGGLLLTIFPLAHYSITPIRQLKVATSKTVEPYQPDDASGFTNTSTVHHDDLDDDDIDSAEARKEGFMGRMSRFRNKQGSSARPTSSARRRRTFRIPSKVPERKHWVTDELTDLTKTFNEMSDELTMQYERLEERVKERTAELERSKQAAEAANQSKTLFIANISHELKTPLNGILGLTTVCMNEDDVGRIRSTLNTIYKSGDLLLHLLTDLLTFSKNEVGQQISIDEAEFRLVDLSSQLMPTFEKQAREGQINLKVLFLGSNDAFGNYTDNVDEKLYGPLGTGRVRDMCLWGDKNRILQVLMNFVSNGLKFTPPNGSVTVRIRCLGLVEHQPKGSSSRQPSQSSRISKSSSKKRVRTSDHNLIIHGNRDEPRSRSNANSVNYENEGKQLSINVAGGTTQIAQIVERRRSMSPPPLNTKDLMFEFEVEDTGPGIPDEQQKKIFEPFVQGDLGLSKKYGGTGLGLSICAQLAALMRGEISLHSKVGEGSKFTMKLPLRYTAEKAASMASSRRTMSKASSMIGDNCDDSEATLQSPPTSSDEPDGRRADIPRIVGFTAPYVAKEVNQESPNDKIKAMRKAENEAAKAGRKVRVLVAEDNKVNQEVVLRMLKLEEVYDVTIAKDGQEAFDRVRESMETGQRYHLVFMDVQMPNVDGIQSTKLIRSMGFSAPIVALTAFAEKSNEDECMASGMDYFLAKPIRRPALKHVLKKYCATIVEEDDLETTITGSSGASPDSPSARRDTLKNEDGVVQMTTSNKEDLVGKTAVVTPPDSSNVSPMS